MSAPARRRATYDEVVAAPDQMVAEIIAGELSLSPRPAVNRFSERSSEDRLRAEPYESFELDLGVLWADVKL